MGISFSCPGSDYDDLDTELEALKVRSISFKGEDVNTIIRTLSFKESDSESSILRSLGSGKMIIEGSLSFNGMKMDPFQVETTFSMASPPIEKEDSTRMASSKSSECNSFEEASPKPCVSDPDNLKTEVATTTFLINDPSCKKEDSIRFSSFKSSDLNNSEEESPEPSVPDPDSPKHEAAVKLQKVYKSFRTRRQLADCAVLVEQSWWKLLDFALLSHSSVSFFDVEKPESVVSRWSRARTRAAKVGKGLLKDEKAQKLALQHWLEAIDPRHRYGHNLHLYYICWLHSESREPFFYWLDVGDGKEVTHERCSRWKLQQQCIKYLGPKEREAYEVIVEDGRFIYKLNGQLVDTSEGNEDSKWIFVLSTSKSLYVGQKKKGKFQHSSFLSGGATSSAGRLVVEQGILKAIWPHSGHYRPTEENFQEFVSFLKENNVDLTDVKKSPAEDDETCSRTRITSFRSNVSRLVFSRDLIASESESINDQQPDGLHHNMSNVSLKNSNEPSLELEVKSCCSPAEYQVSDANLQEACASNHVRVSHVQDLFTGSDGESDEDIENNDMSKSIEFTNMTDVSEACEKQNSSRSLLGTNLERNESWESPASSKYRFHKWNLFEEKTDENQEPSVAPELILNRINSMKGKQFFKWTTGTGPRISCVRDHPSELQFRALEQVNLSPRSAGNSRVTAACSPRITASPTSKLILEGTVS